MASTEVLTGFRVYKDHTQRKSYYRDHHRMTRDMLVVEARFPKQTKTLLHKSNKKLFKNLESLQQISDSFFKRIKLDPEVLDSFRNLVGSSFVNGTIDFESFLSTPKSNHFSLVELLFKTLSKNYDRILDLENQVDKLTDVNAELNSYISDVLDEYEKLRKFAADSKEMRTSEVGKLSEEYQILYEKYTSLQEELAEANQMISFLQSELSRNKKQQQEREKMGYDDESDDKSAVRFNFQQENMDLFDPQIEDITPNDRELEYESKLNDLQRTNDVLFEENIKLRKLKEQKPVQEHFGADKFVTLSILFHQITKSMNKVFQDHVDFERTTDPEETQENINLYLQDSRLRTLDYENILYKDRLMEVETLLKTESIARISLETTISDLKIKLYESENLYLELENLKTSVRTKENELKNMVESGKVESEQLGKMQYMVTNLTYDKNDLLNKISSLEFAIDSHNKERDVMRGQLKKLENLLDQNADKFDFRDKITNIHLQGEIEILNDKVHRMKIQLEEAKKENAELVSTRVKMRNDLERVRRENSELQKRISESVKNESNMTVQIQRLSSNLESLKESLETSSGNVRDMADELEMVKKKIFEKDLQLSLIENKKDELKAVLDDFAIKLSLSKVNKISAVNKIDLKSISYSELIHTLTSSNSGSKKEVTEYTYQYLMGNLEKLINFNEMLVTLCINLSKELNALSGSVLNVTSFSNIFETFNIDLVNVDILKTEHLSEVTDLKLKLKNVSELNKNLANKHLWEKSIIRLKEKYSSTISKHKDIMVQCDKFIKLNQEGLDGLIAENTRLKSDCSKAAFLMVDYENQLSETSMELLHLKEMIYSLLPDDLKLRSEKDAPLRSLELLHERINFNHADFTKLKTSSSVNMSSLVNNYHEQPKHPFSESWNLNKKLENKPHEEREPLYEFNDNKRDYSLVNEHYLLTSKEQELNDVYEDVRYYCNLMASDIKSQMNYDPSLPLDTDYEYSNTNELLSDDTISDYKDEDYVSDKFRYVLNLLDKLFSHYNRQMKEYYQGLNSANRKCTTLVLDTGVIKCITKFVSTLKKYYNTFNNQNSFILDDLQYEFESIPPMLDAHNKFKTFCTCLTKLLNISSEFILDQLSESSEQVSHLIKDIETTTSSMRQLEEINIAKDQQIKSTQFEISDLKNQINHLQTLYQKEKNNNLENKLDLENYEYELNKLRDDLRNQLNKNEKLELLTVSAESTNIRRFLLNDQIDVTKLNFSEIKNLSDQVLEGLKNKRLERTLVVKFSNIVSDYIQKDTENGRKLTLDDYFSLLEYNYLTHSDKYLSVLTSNISW
ncbi:uncharacterized protein TA07945 [Theileria annulata]|uniref:Uncharacterized protein n=1 Tax=Theileria annulata TaxID=5874 RepID=Q4U9W7_THEAN|nr:uncharacterized protein TA07945 [Theileria annulata]CAI76386.1 hypothetical protein, conserved [Theileria annulata]|eukprot:XP_953011.1 hypothetical protein, conserved [Theileria annulata]